MTTIHDIPKDVHRVLYEHCPDLQTCVSLWTSTASCHAALPSAEFWRLMCAIEYGGTEDLAFRGTWEATFRHYYGRCAICRTNYYAQRCTRVACGLCCDDVSCTRHRSQMQLRWAVGYHTMLDEEDEDEFDVDSEYMYVLAS